MGLSNIEKELREKKEKALLEQQNKEASFQKYLERKKNFSAKYGIYLAQLEATFWDCISSFGTLIESEIDINCRPKPPTFFKKETSAIKDDALRVDFNRKMDSYILCIILKIDGNDQRPVLSFESKFWCGGGYHGKSESGPFSLSKFIYRSNLNLLKFESVRAGRWLDNQFEKVYREIEKTYPKYLS